MKSCVVCDNEKAEVRFRRPNWQVVQCAGCGFIYVDFPNPVHQPQFVKDSGRSEEANETGKQYMQGVFVKRHDQWMEYWRGKVAELNRLWGKPPGRVLDIGSAMGHFLLAAKEAGWESVGVELSRPQVAFAREQFGLEVHADMIENLAFPPASFDVVTLWNVIEHLGDPRVVIRQVYDLLKPDGLLLVQTPNQDSLITWLARQVYRLSGGRSMLDVYSDDHLCRFAPDTLRRFLDGNGYQVVHTHLDDNLGIMLARMSMRPYKFLRRVALTGIHAVAGIMGKQNQVFAAARRNGS